MHRKLAHRFGKCGLVAAAVVAVLGTACVDTAVRTAPFRERPDAAEAGKLVGPFSGRVVDATTHAPIAGALVYAAWTLQRGSGLVEPAGAREFVGSTDAGGNYTVPMVHGVGGNARIADFALLVYKRGYIAYRSDRRFADLGPRMDFAQNDNQVLLERWRNELSHARHLRFVGGGTAVSALTSWELADASAELEGKRPSEDLRPGRGEGPYVVAAQLLTETDIKRRTKFDGGFETGPLSDEPDTATYSSQHFKALGRPETWDVAIRMWRLEPAAAQERYDELLNSLPGVTEKDDVASRSFVANENDIRGVGFLDGPRGVVVLITCGVNQCTTIEDASSLAQTVYGKLKQVLPALGTGEVMKRAASLVAVLAIALVGARAFAWEAETTQAGLAEQAALSSKLNHRLVQLGFTGGLFEPLTIPPADAPALIADLKLLSPSDGSVPDARGRQTALAWLAAGAALADTPATSGANHFFDPSTGRGWERPERSTLDRLVDKVRARDWPARGVPAPDWVTDKANPFGLAGFLDQYTKAISAPTPGERSRAMAGALVAAGAMLHVLGDLGSPARVRGDEAAQLTHLGGGPDDLGSRFERIAALAFGRLGVPGPGRIVTRQHLRDYFTTKDGSGLADEIARTYFSPGTLPEPTRVGLKTNPRLQRAQPSVPRLNLVAAARGDITLRDAAGTCLARYKVDHDELSFTIDDDCMLEQVSAILPEVTAFETGLLDFLLRGELDVAIAPGGNAITVKASGLGAGTLQLFVEDDRGVRTPAGTAHAAGAGKEALVGQFPMPGNGARVVVLFRGADAAGEPVVAVGATAMPAR